MMPIVREAVLISRDFEYATFVGAVAVMLHTGEQRQSMDLDFVVAAQVTVDEFLAKGYTIDPRNDDKFTPRGYKIDVYHGRDLNGIPLQDIIETAEAIRVGKKGTTVDAISLEGLVVAKFRAGRDQDLEDLRRLAIRCGPRINWDEIGRLAKSDTERIKIKHAIRFMAQTS